ncbi:Zeta-crystallin [Dactylellina cionopaga]|nr:Zeta-crystallin [Dactylellina cionopaga]
MKSLLINPDLTTTFTEVEIPKPGPREVLIKVAVAGANPKDWKMPVIFAKKSANTCDDVAGFVEAVGSEVFDLKKGDRVMAYHYFQNPYAGYAEYAITPSYMTVKIPDQTSFEEAVTIPLAALTATVALYDSLRLPPPWTPAASAAKTPLVIYGAATACGAFAIKLAQLSNIHPIIGVVGRGKEFAESLIDRSRGDDLVDYRNGNDALVRDIKAALKKNGFESVDHVFDAVSEHGSVVDSAAVLGEQGTITGVLPLELDPKAAGFNKDAVKWILTSVSLVWGEKWPPSAGTETVRTLAGKDFGYIFIRWFVKGLDEGWFRGHPHEVIKGGLNGVEQALRDLKDGKASAVKYVFRIEDTN